jgi:hypothetical protein
LFKVRFLLALHPEIFPYGTNIESRTRSEYLVSTIWNFPLVYEDDELKVYATGF